jgi:hypothetical protein
LVDTKDGAETSSRFQAVDGNSEFTMNNTGKTFPKLQSTKPKESPLDYCIEGEKLTFFFLKDLGWLLAYINIR